jgi:hypothetical protein
MVVFSAHEASSREIIMKKLLLPLLAALVGILSITLNVTPASAQATRTWVSGVGDDVNPCSRTAPCKTFAGAISKTAAGGEIDCLDPGGFGAVTIVKAMTIDCGTNAGGILSSGTNGVNVVAGVNDKVVLRNLVINGSGTGINGIRFTAGKELVLDRVVIQEVTTAGLDVAQTQGANLILKDVTITQAQVGIKIATTVGSINGVMNNVLITDTTSHGVQAISNAAITMNKLISARNGGDGVRSEAASVNLNVRDSIIHGSGIAFDAVAGTIRVQDSGIFFNNQNFTASVQSDGTNRSAGNTTNVAPTAGGYLVN